MFVSITSFPLRHLAFDQAGLAGLAARARLEREDGPMNLHHLLAERQAKRGRPVRVGLIGCGKFASMFLAQARRTPGLQVAGTWKAAMAPV